MGEFRALNLIHLFDFYLMFLFALGLWRRFGQYRQIAQLVLTGPGRWPNLLKLVRQHHTIFMTGPTLLPAFLALLLSLVQLIAPNEMRGRVMSIYMLAFRGGMPLGSLISGWLAVSLGAPTVIGINGGLLVLVAVYFLIWNHGVLDS